MEINVNFLCSTDIVQNDWNGYILETLNNIDVFCYSPLKNDKSFSFNYEELPDPRETMFNNDWLQT